MKTLSLTEVKMKLSQFVDEVTETDNPVSITKNGIPVATLISQSQYDGWKHTLEIMRSPDHYKRVQEYLVQLNRGEGISLTPKELFSGEEFQAVGSAGEYRVRLLPALRKQLGELSGEFRRRVAAGLHRLGTGEEHGIALKDAMDGLYFMRLGNVGLLYRWRMHTLELVNLDLRGTAYRGGEPVRF